MGAAQSRARPGTGPTRGGRYKPAGGGHAGQDHAEVGKSGSGIRGHMGSASSESSHGGGGGDGGGGYFILCIKTSDRNDRIKVVNAAGSVHKLLTAIIRRNTVIIKSGWDRHLVFSYKLQKSPRGRHALIQVSSSRINDNDTRSGLMWFHVFFSWRPTSCWPCSGRGGSQWRP